MIDSETVDIFDSSVSLKSYYYQKSTQFKLLLHKVLPQSFESYIHCLNEKDLYQVLYSQNLFGSNVIRKIFFDKYKAYVHREVVSFYRQIINQAPPSIKKKIQRVFRRYFKLNHINKYFLLFFKKNGIDVDWFRIEGIEDYSVGSGVYKLSALIHYQGRESCICFFVKLSRRSYLENEPFFAQILDQMRSSVRTRPSMVHCLIHQDQYLLISPLIPGISSEILLSDILRSQPYLQEKSPDFLFEFYKCIIFNSPLSDLLARTDRHLSNSHIQVGKNLKGLYFDNKIQQDLPLEQIGTDYLVALKKDLMAGEMSFIPFDCQYLLDQQNKEWIYEDICQGISELNTVSLLFPHFLMSLPSMDPFLIRLSRIIVDIYCCESVRLKENLPLMKQKIKEHYSSHLWDEKIETLDNFYALVFNQKHYSKILYHLFVDYRLRLFCKKAIQTMSLSDIPDSYSFLHSIFDTSYHLVSASIQMESFRGVNSIVDSAGQPFWDQVYEIILSLMPHQRREIEQTKIKFKEQYDRVMSQTFD